MKIKDQCFGFFSGGSFRFEGALKDSNGLHAGFGPVGEVFETVGNGQVRNTRTGLIETVLNSGVRVFPL